jgi:hypothetical protein
LCCAANTLGALSISQKIGIFCSTQLPQNYPQTLKDKVGPRNMVHSWATDVDDPAEQPRWGKIGKQKIEDAGPLCPDRIASFNMEAVKAQIQKALSSHTGE